MALTGSSTCTLIAFVFPALLFVQAATEAQGKSDETVRVYRMYTPPGLKHCALLLLIGFSWGLLVSASRRQSIKYGWLWQQALQGAFSERSRP